MRRILKWVGIALAVLIALAIVGAIIGDGDEKTSSPAAAEETTTEETVEEGPAQPQVTGKVRGRFNRDCFLCDERLVTFIKTRDVWCGWQDDKVVVHVTMRNDSVEHITVNWHPSYVIAGGGEHGAGLTAVQSHGFDASETRDLLVEQDPEGVTPNAEIETCKPSFSVIESG